MAKSSSHNPFSPTITPKEEHVTLDKPESPNPFLPADQIEFTFEEIAFTTNNELALLYPLHPNSEYFRNVSNFISKCCLKEAFIRAPTQYKEYLSEFWYTVKTLDDFKIWVSTTTGGIRGDIGINTFRNALRAHYLPHSNVLVESKAPKPSSQTEKVPQGKKLGAKKKETQSSSAKDKSPSHPLPPTSVVGEMHKEVQQAAGGPTSLGDTSEEGAHSQLSSGHDASVDSTAKADLGLSAPNDSIPAQ
uniref:Uncharacterized protein n=1 Tax=Tanacetum cinerariifolium TaxID=118510 RepID=A0A6L2M8U2_TANCI|nr:hypothetical protein [Tanacetum cinerariifolium]